MAYNEWKISIFSNSRPAHIKLEIQERNMMICINFLIAANYRSKKYANIVLSTIFLNIFNLQIVIAFRELRDKKRVGKIVNNSYESDFTIGK